MQYMSTKILVLNKIYYASEIKFISVDAPIQGELATEYFICAGNTNLC